MNKVLLIGRLTRDPEVKETVAGIKYARFTIAVNKPTKDSEADFIPVVAWRNTADFMEKYIKKGALVSVEGRFTSSSYSNSDNVKVTRYEIAAERVEGLEPKGKDTKSNGRNEMEGVQEFRPKEDKPVETSKQNDVPWQLDI